MKYIFWKLLTIHVYYILYIANTDKILQPIFIKLKILNPKVMFCYCLLSFKTGLEGGVTEDDLPDFRERRDNLLAVLLNGPSSSTILPVLRA